MEQANIQLRPCCTLGLSVMWLLVARLLAFASAWNYFGFDPRMETILGMRCGFWSKSLKKHLLQQFFSRSSLTLEGPCFTKKMHQAS
jgi:hypothetical protein